MNDDLQISWNPASLDIGGLPAQTLGYKIWNMSDPLNPAEVADVNDGSTTVTLTGFVTDPINPPPIAVSAYNSIGDGARSATVIASPPGRSVPETVTGVTAIVIPV